MIIQKNNNNNNLFPTQSDTQGCYSKIYFAQFRGKSLCFKSFPLHNEEEFQSIFIKAVKEWSILKICSTLQCAPYLQNFLGFDLIVYEDCIQFSLQKGTQINQLCSKEISQLKEQLRLMHEFKIIHCDIKPQNIIFSHHFNKPVFIDFGFAQIVNESFGFKTLSTFKGTPKFCTKQMLSIILNKKDFIDLYYNDAYSLQETCKYLRPSLIQQCQAQQVIFEKGDYLKWTVLKKIEQELISFSIQYHYIFGKEQKLSQLLKDYLSKNSQNIKKVLLFIKKCVNYKFLPHFFKQDLKQFSVLVEYEQIQQKIKLGGQALCFIINQNSQSFFNTNKISLLTPQLTNTSQILRYQQYLKIILDIQNIEPQMISYYLVIVFQCVRFDEKNLQFKDKVKITNKMNPLLLEYSKNNSIKNNYISNEIKAGQNLEITQIKILMRLILNQFLNFQPNKWMKDFLFGVFRQLIILNDDYSQVLDILSKFLSQNKQIFDPVFILNQLEWVLKMISMMKGSVTSQQIINSKLNNFIQEFSSSIKIKYQGIQNLSIDKFASMPQIYQTKLKQIEQVNNINAKRTLFQFLIIKAHQQLFKSGKQMEIIKIIQFVKKSPYFYHYSTFVRYKIMIDLMYAADNKQAVRKYFNCIASTINCPQIYKNIDKQKYFLQNIQSLTVRIDILIQKLTHLTHLTLNTEIYFEFLTLFVCHPYQIKDKDLQSKFVQLYYTYYQQKHRINKNSDNKIQLYLDIYQQAKIQGFFYKLSSQTKTAYLQTLKEYQKIFASLLTISKGSKEFQFQTSYVKYKVTLYKWYLLLLNDKYQQPLYLQNCKYLQEIISIYKQKQMRSLMIEVIKDLCQASIRWRIQQAMQYSLAMLFNNSKKLNHLVYLNEPHYIIPTLFVFARHNKTAFIQLLVNLTEFLSLNLFHSTKSYFLNFINYIDQFIKNDHMNSYLIHHSYFLPKYSKVKLRNNPYLLIFYAYSLFNQSADQKLRILKIFALNCNYLTNFAKNKLFQRYYRVVVTQMKTKSKRQRIYVFREAKNYIGQIMKLKQAKQLFKTNQKYLFNKLLKKMINDLVKN